MASGLDGCSRPEFNVSVLAGRVSAGGFLVGTFNSLTTAYHQTCDRPQLYHESSHILLKAAPRLWNGRLRVIYSYI